MTAPLPGVPSPERPLYGKILQNDSGATRLFIVTCDEGWRVSVVCYGMYEWAADWLLGLIQGKPYAPGTRP